jgi:hypothetical protein
MLRAVSPLAARPTSVRTTGSEVQATGAIRSAGGLPVSQPFFRDDAIEGPWDARHAASASHLATTAPSEHAFRNGGAVPAVRGQRFR